MKTHKKKKKIKRKPIRINTGWVVLGTGPTHTRGTICLEMTENSEKSGRKPACEQHLLLHKHPHLEGHLLEGKGGKNRERALTELKFNS